MLQRNRERLKEVSSFSSKLSNLEGNSVDRKAGGNPSSEPILSPIPAAEHEQAHRLHLQRIHQQKQKHEQLLKELPSVIDDGEDNTTVSSMTMGYFGRSLPGMNITAREAPQGGGRLNMTTSMCHSSKKSYISGTKSVQMQQDLFKVEEVSAEGSSQNQQEQIVETSPQDREHPVPNQNQLKTLMQPSPLLKEYPNDLVLGDSTTISDLTPGFFISAKHDRSSKGAATLSSPNMDITAIPDHDQNPLDRIRTTLAQKYSTPQGEDKEKSIGCNDVQSSASSPSLSEPPMLLSGEAFTSATHNVTVTAGAPSPPDAMDSETIATPQQEVAIPNNTSLSPRALVTAAMCLDLIATNARGDSENGNEFNSTKNSPQSIKWSAPTTSDGLNKVRGKFVLRSSKQLLHAQSIAVGADAAGGGSQNSVTKEDFSNLWEDTRSVGSNDDDQKNVENNGKNNEIYSLFEV